MLEKRFLVILSIVNILLVGGLAFVYFKTDKEGPVITPTGDIVYSADVTEQELLSLIQAVDAEDGDVSRTLIIEKIVPDKTAKTAWITCGAQDERGNISKYTWRVACDESVFETEEKKKFSFAVGEAESMLPSDRENEQGVQMQNAAEQEASDEETENENREADGENVDGENADSENADGAEENNEDINQDSENNEEDISENDSVTAEPQENARTDTPPAEEEQQTVSNVPTLAFSASEIKTKKGYNPAWVTVIARLSDDKDSYETLLHNLKIQGNFDNATVGSYDVTVLAADSEGNESAASPIRIIVEE